MGGFVLVATVDFVKAQLGLSDSAYAWALASILFKDLGWSNAVVGGASLLALPSALRFLWAPRVDRLAAKRPLCWRFTAAMALTLLALAGLMAAGFAGQAVLFGGLLLFAVFHPPSSGSPASRASAMDSASAPSITTSTR